MNDPPIFAGLLALVAALVVVAYAWTRAPEGRRARLLGSAAALGVGALLVGSAALVSDAEGSGCQGGLACIGPDIQAAIRTASLAMVAGALGVGAVLSLALGGLAGPDDDAEPGRPA
ncbi:MAG TPA: hypothetical protein VHH36_06575 [Candidatus Thermoplasmatota archaeon]|nr:hypothetical protein [Candidatus Thermoplasmatota archaeon]